MALNITTGTATPVGVVAAIIVQVNAALTGNFTVTTAGSTQYGTSSSTVATVTNPTVGSLYKYGGLSKQGIVSVTPSTTCDITVTVTDRLR